MLPVLGRNAKKIQGYFDWLLLMQFPRRNVDFSNLGLIGRHREEKTFDSAPIADGISQCLGLPVVLSRLRSFLAPQ